MLSMAVLINLRSLGDEREPVLGGSIREVTSVGTHQRVDRTYIEVDPVRVGSNQWDEH
jgi:hypothetical protein